jgi:drug/metabolite transporter (DMT)-like permease
MTKNKVTDFVLLHAVVLIYGFTGILGKLITLPADALTWWRMLLASIALVVYVLAKGIIRQLRGGPTWIIAAVGVIIAVHWITFFEAIKQSNVSVALATMSSTALFVAVLSPLFGKRKFESYEMILGLIAIGGLVLIFGFETQYWLGITLALVSSLLAAIFTLANAELIKRSTATAITTVEMMAGAGALTGYLAVTGKIDGSFLEVSSSDLFYLILLAVVATAFAFVVSVEIMKRFSPFTVAITINLEPVYSIILALLIFGPSEEMSMGFYAGAVIIVATIFVNAYLKSRKGRETS